MAWLLLVLAAVFEVMFAMGMKMSHGFTRLTPTLVTIVGIIFGLWFLALAMKQLPVSIAYPVWTALGTLGTVALGTLLLGEAMTPLKAVSVLAIVGGVIGLKISGG
ncbi:multidrug efflux SMR transporter [Sulfitobacter sp. G21635-S1]|jgi:quaternary ammonium compound-resistance protein SugE|uniref:DMT family transporter n=1 Tax=Sulfitobacter sp. G21635-S1 TaxID=3014043 RepID=UPI0022B0398B|nr:multidrug efflux SMR transporter [Sulfitobacter sp. G21635-S1]MCZ4257743.1 multidrug efflux SMR transporter [Sulfitobacter sp. G21635-S1]